MAKYVLEIYMSDTRDESLVSVQSDTPFAPIAKGDFISYNTLELPDDVLAEVMDGGKLEVVEVRHIFTTIASALSLHVISIYVELRPIKKKRRDVQGAIG